jgi:hypothetical protein
MPRIVKIGIRRPATQPLLPDPLPREVKYIFISVVDHLVEPPDTFKGRLPRKLQARAPKIIETAVPNGYGVVGRQNIPNSK